MNGVSDLTRQRGLAGRLVTDDRDNHERELDAQGRQLAPLVLDCDIVGEAAIAQLVEAALDRGEDITGRRAC